MIWRAILTPPVAFVFVVVLSSQFQSLLTDYLDIQNVAPVDAAAVASGFVDQSTNINTFFGRRKQQ